jgi:hypothetical protein
LRRSIADSNGNSNSTVCDPDRYSDGNSNGNVNSDTNSNTDTDTNADAKGYPDPQTSADSAPSRVVANADLSAVAPPLRRGAKADSCDF